MLENILFPKKSAITPNPSFPCFNYPSPPLITHTAEKNSCSVGAGARFKYGLSLTLSPIHHLNL